MSFFEEVTRISDSANAITKEIKQGAEVKAKEPIRRKMESKVENSKVKDAMFDALGKKSIFEVRGTDGSDMTEEDAKRLKEQIKAKAPGLDYVSIKVRRGALIVKVNEKDEKRMENILNSIKGADTKEVAEGSGNKFWVDVVTRDKTLGIRKDMATEGINLNAVAKNILRSKTFGTEAEAENFAEVIRKEIIGTIIDEDLIKSVEVIGRAKDSKVRDSRKGKVMDDVLEDIPNFKSRKQAKSWVEQLSEEEKFAVWNYITKNTGYDPIHSMEDFNTEVGSMDFFADVLYDFPIYDSKKVRDDDNEIEDKKESLAKFFGVSSEEIKSTDKSIYGLSLFEYDGDEYAVGTDGEADYAVDIFLEQYLNESIYPELSESARKHFDYVKWKNNAKLDGRGHSISPHDGNEIKLDNGYYAYHM